MVYTEKIHRTLRRASRPNLFVSFAVVAAVLVAGWLLLGGTTPNAGTKEVKEIKIAGQNIKVELASSDEQKSRGLSGRTELRDEEGMLFIFEQPGRYSFWMKGMNFPLDIIWINEGMKVVHIKKNARPERYPESYLPEENAKYVLEVNAGFSDKYELKEGDSVRFAY